MQKTSSTIHANREIRILFRDYSLAVFSEVMKSPSLKLRNRGLQVQVLPGALKKREDSLARRSLVMRIVTTIPGPAASVWHPAGLCSVSRHATAAVDLTAVE